MNNNRQPKRGFSSPKYSRSEERHQQAFESWRGANDSGDSIVSGFNAHSVTKRVRVPSPVPFECLEVAVALAGLVAMAVVGFLLIRLTLAGLFADMPPHPFLDLARAVAGA